MLASRLLATRASTRLCICKWNQHGQNWTVTSNLSLVRPATTANRWLSASSSANNSNNNNSNDTVTSNNSGGEGIFGRIRQTFEDRSKRRQAEKYAAQLQKMASQPHWTLQDYVKDLDDAVNSWRNKIPGMSQLHQNKMAKQAQTVVKAVLEEVGASSTMTDLHKLGRRQKLRIALKSGATMEDLNLLLKQFQAVDMMHQVLRYRKKNGKPIPTDEASMKAAVQADSANAVNKETKEHMKAAQRKRFGGANRRRK